MVHLDQNSILKANENAPLDNLRVEDNLLSFRTSNKTHIFLLLRVPPLPFSLLKPYKISTDSTQISI